MKKSIALVLVCKRPKPGLGKQRLAASLGVEMTQRVAEALLDCALEDLRSWVGSIVIAPSSQEDVEWAMSLMRQSNVCVQPQVSGNLGQRLNTLDFELRSKGMKQLIYIGSDSPGLIEADYAAVCDAMQYHDVVLMPAIDGGVVLMANNHPWPPLSDLPWSSDQLRDTLADCCRDKGQSVATLDESFDIDELEDLVKLIAVLADDSRPARRILRQLASDIISKAEVNHA